MLVHSVRSALRVFCVQFVAGATGFRFFCQTCPYVHNITRKISRTTVLKRKEVDDVLGGEDAWKNVDQTEGLSGLVVMFPSNVLLFQPPAQSVSTLTPTSCKFRLARRMNQ